MSLENDWMVVADEAMNAAVKLKEMGCWRSSVNRSYYAAHAAVHAMGVRSKLTLPKGRNNWSHQDLPGVLMAVVKGPTGGHESRMNAQLLKGQLEVCLNNRVTGDYRPQRRCNEEEARQSVSAALRVMGKARKVWR